MHAIDFVVEPHPAYVRGEVLGVEPLVDGVRLSELVERYEQASSFEPAGGYGGIIPGHFQYGSLASYFLGAPETSYWQKVGRVALLGCGDCGEVGCWPLYSLVSTDDQVVSWRSFEQPHRVSRDYDAFGPFEFDRNAYVTKLTGALVQLDDE